MAIPEFDISQNDNHLIISISVPNILVDSMKIQMDGDIFKFSGHKYLMTLDFHGLISTLKAPYANLDTTSGILCVYIPKVYRCFHISGLKNPHSFLAAKRRTKISDLANILEPIPEEEEHSPESDCSNDDSPDGVFYSDVTCLEESIRSFNLNSEAVLEGYGFDNQYKGIFHDALHLPLFKDVFEGLNPEYGIIGKTMTQLRQICDERIEKKFDEDAFILDSANTAAYSHCLKFEPWFYWLQQAKSQMPLKERLRNVLNKKEFELLNMFYVDKACPTDCSTDIVYALSSILYSYCYCLRTFAGDISAESLWMVLKMSCVLSCFCYSSNAFEFVETHFKRSITYSLFRCIELHEFAIDDLVYLLSCDLTIIIRALLKLSIIFNQDLECWRLNSIWIEDLICFLISCDENTVNATMREVASEISCSNMGYTKMTINGWNIEQLLSIWSDEEPSYIADENSNRSYTPSSLEESEDIAGLVNFGVRL
jgi:hypothetical protein